MPARLRGAGAGPSPSDPSTDPRVWAEHQPRRRRRFGLLLAIFLLVTLGYTGFRYRRELPDLLRRTTTLLTALARTGLRERPPPRDAGPEVAPPEVGPPESVEPASPAPDAPLPGLPDRPEDPGQPPPPTLANPPGPASLPGGDRLTLDPGARWRPTSDGIELLEGRALLAAAPSPERIHLPGGWVLLGRGALASVRVEGRTATLDAFTTTRVTDPRGETREVPPLTRLELPDETLEALPELEARVTFKRLVWLASASPEAAAPAALEHARGARETARGSPREPVALALLESAERWAASAAR